MQTITTLLLLTLTKIIELHLNLTQQAIATPDDNPYLDVLKALTFLDIVCLIVVVLTALFIRATIPHLERFSTCQGIVAVVIILTNLLATAYYFFLRLTGGI